MKTILQYFPVVIIVAVIIIVGDSCANIVPPAGGPKDSLPPVLVSATPPDSAKSVRPSKITLSFNEYIDQIQNATENVIISPTLPTIPQIDSRLRTVTVRFKDTLEPNTTYSINFGNSIKDVNEGNVLQGFTYVFSTGSTIDDNTLSGKVIMAETGRVDSTLIAILHRDLSDSAIIKQRPRYYTKVDGSGNFTFYHLPKGQFKLYVIENGYMKQYDDSTKVFGFLNNPVTVSDTTAPVTLYAYQQAKRSATTTTTQSGGGGGGRGADRRLRYVNSEGTSKDVLSSLQLDFTRKLKTFDSAKIFLADTNLNKLQNVSVRLDSNRTRITVHYPWQLDTKYKLIILKEAVADVDGITLFKNDTITLTSKKADDYGSLKIRFTNLDLTKNPVLQIVQNNEVVESTPLTGREYKKGIVKPGEYELRILYDQNKNGIWDAGNYKLKKQPELVLSLSKKITVKPRWENEEEIVL